METIILGEPGEPMLQTVKPPIYTLEFLANRLQTRARSAEKKTRV